MGMLRQVLMEIKDENNQVADGWKKQETTG